MISSSVSTGPLQRNLSRVRLEWFEANLQCHLARAVIISAQAASNAFGEPANGLHEQFPVACVLFERRFVADRLRFPVGNDWTIVTSHRELMKVRAQVVAQRL
jgi:hypothetical protein